MSRSVGVPQPSAAALQPSQAQNIPAKIKNPTTGQYIPLSSTPGGSIYGTTPGGSRIQYDRSALLQYRNSPLSRSPLIIDSSISVISNLRGKGGDRKIEEQEDDEEEENEKKAPKSNKKSQVDDEEMFEME